MTDRLACALIAVGVLTFLGCSRPQVWMEPRMDLSRYGTLGLVEFRSADGHGPMATQKFLAHLHGAQGGVPVLELGPLAQVLEGVGHRELAPEAARAIGEKYRVDVLVLGEVDLESVRPSFSIQSFTEANARAEIHGQMSARFVETRSGATIWSDEARGKRTLARVDLADGRRPDFAAVDPEGEQTKLVTWLVARVTDDFRGRWVRR